MTSRHPANRSFKQVTWLFALTCVGACGMEAPDAPEDLQGVQQEIRGGWTTPTTQKPGIGKVRLAAGGGQDCSGVLITRRHVLTAARCNLFQDTLTPGTNQFTMPEASQVFYNITRIYLFGGDSAPQAVPGLDFNTDVALLELDIPVFSFITPIMISPVPPLAGETISYYGFGQNNSACTAGAGVRTQGEFPFGIFSDFICPGDAGGPATLGAHAANGLLWGVNSHISGNGDVWGNLARYKEDIMDVIRTWDNFGSGSTNESGIRRIGVTFQVTTPGSPGACMNQCNANPSCASYSWHNPSGSCALMRDRGEWYAEPNFTSGLSIANRYEVDIDRPGRDYSNDAPVALNTCSARCSGDSRCAAFSWVASQSRCFLKEYAPPGVAAPGITSGTKRKFEYYTDRPGLDLYNFAIVPPALPDPRVCQAACYNDINCWSFTYKNPVYTGNPPTLVSNAHCFLKSGTPAPSIQVVDPPNPFSTKRFISGSWKHTP